MKGKLLDFSAHYEIWLILSRISAEERKGGRVYKERGKVLQFRQRRAVSA